MWSGKKMANSLETHQILPVTILPIPTLISQLGIIMAGIETTGENVVREKYGEIVQNPPLYTGHNNPE